MTVSSATAADALRPLIRDYDVDDDTLESLSEMVADAANDTPEGLAQTLEELLEPFLLAWGANPDSVKTTAMSVAVAVQGLPPEPAKKEEKPIEKPKEEILVALKKEDVGAPVPKKQAVYPKTSNAPKASAPPAAESKGGFTLEDFCSAPSTNGKAKAKGGGYNAAPAKAKGGGYNAKPDLAEGKPLSMGSLWATKVDSKNEASAAWNVGLTQGDSKLIDREKGDDSESDENEENKGKSEGVQGKKVNDKRAARKAAVEAAIKGEGKGDDFADVAAFGLKETQEALAHDNDADWEKSKEKGGKFKKRGVHVEGAGSKNVHLENISLTIHGAEGTIELLRDTNLHFQAGHVYGLVGKNGSGKTTLMRKLANKQLAGFPMHMRVGYVAQELPPMQSGVSALEAVVLGDEERTALLEERDELDKALEGADKLTDKAAKAEAETKAARFAEIEQRLMVIDADGAEERAREALTWLNFDEATMNKAAASLSGGWRMRLALATALCSRPDLLLLDEPTNHLDLHGVLWLQNHLHRQWGAGAPKKDRVVAIVSHDRAFLDGCATDVCEIYNCKLRNFPGNYSQYMDQVGDEQRLALLAREEEDKAQKNEMKELKAMKKTAREHKDEKKLRQLKSMEKKVEKSREERKDQNMPKLSSGEIRGGEDLVSKLREDQSLRFKFPPIESFTDANLVELDGAKVRQGQNVILKDLILTLDCTSRVAIVGANGSGKSTIMKALAGELKAEEGPRGRGKKHPAYDPGFVTQNHLESQAKSLHQHCLAYLRGTLPTEKDVKNAHLTKESEDSLLWAQLGNFGLGKDALKKLGYLSGGQKARLSLAVATAQRPNVLLLDEPTNHLDVDSLDALTLGLQSFEGAVVVVSHNRGFLEALCDELWICEKGTVRSCPKGEDAFVEFFSEYAKGVQNSINR
eukprot:gnl/MRDRNA2_/MRDRNA2_91127_c0_seq1.p1 gnl/MRDRNA2_/MRDRNA2_91127_c0~~gnl/MRDRNA2_/MRDRNA2_91127_c0_seq1.p1  ORF type:complete len:919 (-),score=266.75 gnl/MRDRNA2_/MRDRNA2_91127_c0_seq1:75-2831(-)